MRHCPTCKSEVDPAAKFCMKCGVALATNAKKQPGGLAVVIGIVLIFFFLKSIGSWLSGPSTPTKTATPAAASIPAPAVTEAKEKRIVEGGQGYLVSGAEKIFIATDESSYKALTKAAIAKDNIGLANLLLSGRIFVVPSKTKILVLDRGILSTEVRVLDGDEFGKSGLVPTEWVKP